MTTFKRFAEQSEIEISCVYKGVHADKGAPAKEPWHHFLWEVTLTRDLGARLGVFTTEYRLGLAYCSRGREGDGKARHRTGKIATTQPVTSAIARALKPYGATISDVEGFVYPTPPSLESMLQSLQSDAQSGEYLLFEDFASEFGYDTDSRAAEAIWRKCQDVRGRLQKFFSGSWVPGGDKGAVQMWDAFLELTEDETEETDSETE